MIKIIIGGGQLSAGQSQLVIFSPYIADTINTPGVVNVGASAVQVISNTNAAAQSWSWIFENISVGGQRIAFGFDNTVTVAGSGLILEPGDVWCSNSMDFNLFAIASATGGQLRRWVLNVS